MVLLPAMVLITIIGLSATLNARITTQRAMMDTDATYARFNAQSAIDRGLLIIEEEPSSWRSTFSANGGKPVDQQALGKGTITLTAEDPLDGNVNNGPDPVLLTGIGLVGKAKQMFQVTLDGDGVPIEGTWRRHVIPQP